jgi:hypothetical protein
MYAKSGLATGNVLSETDKNNGCEDANEEEEE